MPDIVHSIAKSLIEAAGYYREYFTRMEPSCKVAVACGAPIDDDTVPALWGLI